MASRASWVVPLTGMLFIFFLSGLSACSQSSAPPSQPSASATLLVKVNTESASTLPAPLYVPGAVVKSQIAHLVSEEIRSDVLEVPEVQATQWYQSFDGDNTKALVELGTMLLAETEHGTLLIHLTLNAEDAEEAKTILTQWIAVFLRAVESSQSSNIELAQQAYQADLDTALQDVADLTAAIFVFENVGVRTTIEGRLNDLNRSLQILTDRRTESMEGLVGAQAFHDMLLRRSESETPEPTSDEIPLIEHTAEVSGLRAQIRQLQVGGGAEGQIQILEQALDVEIDRQFHRIFVSKIEDARLGVSILQERIEHLDPQILSVQTRLQDILRRRVERESLHRSLHNAEDRVERARERLDDIEILTPRIVIVTQLTPPKINQP